MNAQPPCKIIKPTFFVGTNRIGMWNGFSRATRNGNPSLGPIQREKSRRNDETAVQRGGNSWRDWSKLGTRTLAKLEARRRHYLLTGEHSECLLKRYE